MNLRLPMSCWVWIWRLESLGWRSSGMASLSASLESDFSLVERAVPEGIWGEAPSSN